MSLSQTMTRRRDADLLQRALDGDPEVLGHRLLQEQSGDLAQLLRLAEEAAAGRGQRTFVVGLCGLHPLQARPDAVDLAADHGESLGEHGEETQSLPAADLDDGTLVYR